jgi:hypothetical protein
MKSNRRIRALVTFLLIFGIGEVLDFLFFGASHLNPAVAAVYENISMAVSSVIVLYLLGIFDLKH